MAPRSGRSRSLLKAAWRTYLRRAQRHQSTALLTLVYVLVVGPTALVTRLARVRLLPGDVPRNGTHWSSRRGIRPSLDDLKRPY